jgi:hypothetical protein
MKLRCDFRHAWLGVLSALVLAVPGLLPESAHATGTSSARWSVWSTNGIVDAVLPVPGHPTGPCAQPGEITTVYAGGYFTRIGGQPRNGIAALDAITGAASAWNPNATPADSGVGAIAVSGSTVYVGGKFEKIAGQPRNGIAALDSTTGSEIPLDLLDLHGTFALALSGSSVYVGGDDGVAAVPITPLALRLARRDAATRTQTETR